MATNDLANYKLKKLAEGDKMKVSILCDAENQQPLNIDYVYQFLKSKVLRVDVKVFGDERFISKKWKKLCKNLGFAIIHTPHQEQIKDTADKAIVQYAMKVFPRFDLLIFITGDGDFKLPICMLKSKLTIIGMGSGNNVSKEIKTECDDYIELSNKKEIQLVLNKLITKKNQVRQTGLIPAFA